MKSLLWFIVVTSIDSFRFRTCGYFWSLRFSNKIQQLQKSMLTNLQALELSSQALEEGNSFYACDRYLLSYPGKFPLVKNIYLLFSLRWEDSVTQPWFRPAEGRDRHYVDKTSSLIRPVSALLPVPFLIYLLSFELRILVYKAFLWIVTLIELLQSNNWNKLAYVYMHAQLLWTYS